MLLLLTMSLLCAIIGYLKPVSGFGLFLLFNTGLGGFFDKAGLVTPQLGPLQPGTLACVMAIFSLLIRKTDNSTNRTAPNFILLLMRNSNALLLTSPIAHMRNGGIERPYMGE